MSETFEEYWNEYNQEAHTGLPIFDGGDEVLAREIWNHQQKKVDELEQKLSLLENTGMIGVSPAQFMEKVRALESKLAKAMEALRVINSYPETLVFADVFTVARKTLEEIGEQE